METASRLFYTEGIRGVGVDRVMAEANVARGSFYRHFAGKEDLVRAYLEATDQDIRMRVRKAREHTDGPEALLRGMAQGIGGELCTEGFRGCPFINAAAEYPDRTSPVHQAVLTHRTWFHQLIVDAFTELGAADPEWSASATVALRDGAMVAGYLSDPQSARKTLLRGVDTLLAAR
ncbi:TetR/AcrR family transcriptional regulator [Streptomyces chromofuscus]|uniref:TetR/AcrR family transcriptional regulator n=1 Tax=Streptomyces chromofuscus TaxID=42881 RepID=UPI00199AC690|nr:TetR/AcrR family transcriptional regulator [Streptomyces chromofuscus]GGT38522.1 TetR family transcriptional regulator [Streptomyces chromofuscus]